MNSYPFALWCAIPLALSLAFAVAAALARLGFPIAPVGQRYGGVDGMRGMLALLVICHHFSIWLMVMAGRPWEPPAFNMLNQFGKGAVGLFFMITGLVFYPRILDGFARVDWPTLYIRRIFRIVPLVAFSVLCVILVIVASGRAQFAWKDVVHVASWVGTLYEPDLLGYSDAKRINAQVLWSLRFEWIFYFLLLPGLAALSMALRGRLPNWALPAGLIVLGLGMSLLHYWLSYLSLFAFGMLAYEVRERPVLASWFCRPLATSLAVVALLLALFLTPNPYSFSMPAFGFFMICVTCGNTFGGFLASRPMRVLGECSFSIYVLHGIVLYVVFGQLQGRGLAVSEIAWMIVPIVACVVPITAITYLVIERPLNRLGKRVADGLTHFRARGGDVMEAEIAP